MSQNSTEHIETNPPSIAATAGSSPSPHEDFLEEFEPSTEFRDPIPPTIEPPTLKMNLLSTLMSELTNDDISSDPNLQDFIEMHKSLKRANIDDSPPAYNWELISGAFDYIYTLYFDEMQEINLKFKSLDAKRSTWLQSVTEFDGQRAEIRIQNVESWISFTQSHINQMNSDLQASIEVIKTTLNKFN